MSHVAASQIYDVEALVFKHSYLGTSYVAAVRIDGGEWKLISYLPLSPANNITVINQAIVALTAGRTWKEKVQVLGNYTISASITISTSYTILEGGKYTLSDGVNDDVIVVGPATDVEVRSVEIDGNAANQASDDYSGIRLRNVTDGLVEECKIYNCRRLGITTYNCNRCTIFNNIIHDIYDVAAPDKGYGIFMWGTVVGDSQYNEIIGNTIYNILLDGIGCHQQQYNIIADNNIYNVDTYGIPLADSHHNVIVGNQLTNCQYGIILMAPTPTYNVIVGNDVDAATKAYGINIAGNYNTVSGNNVYNFDYRGISFVGGNENVICDNTIFGVTYATCVYGTGNFNILSGNTIHGGRGPGIHINGGDDNIVVDNILNDTAKYHASAITLANADRTKVRNNKIIGHGVGSYYAIDIDANCDSTEVFGNDFVGTFPSGIINDLGTNTKMPWLWAGLADTNVYIGDFPAVELTNGAAVSVRNQLLIPEDFHQLVSAVVVIIPGATGNLRRSVDTDYGAIGEAYNTHSESIAAGEVAVTANVLTSISVAAALTGIAAGDFVGITFTRHADHVNDTVEANCYYLGILVRYV